MDLIDDDGCQIGKLFSEQKDVAENFSGHHAARRISPDHQIARDQSDLIFSEEPAVIAEFLVRESLDWSGEDHFASLREGLLLVERWDGPYLESLRPNCHSGCDLVGRLPDFDERCPSKWDPGEVVLESFGERLGGRLDHEARELSDR